jgi:hypothetical protein
MVTNLTATSTGSERHLRSGPRARRSGGKKNEPFSLVTVQDGHEFVSATPLTQEDAHGLLQVELVLHWAAGWQVAEYGSFVVARRGSVVRLICARNDTRESRRPRGIASAA